MGNLEIIAENGMVSERVGMLKLNFLKHNNGSYKILCIGAHSDDIEIGCGGTILRLLKNSPYTEVYWVVFAASEQRAIEATQSADLFLTDAKKKRVVINNFRESFFPYIGTSIKESFERLKDEFSPDLILTHYRNDLHQDHRLISELTWNTFRNHLILEYEIIKYDGDLGAPNFFVHLDEETCRKKVNYILTCFKTQQNRNWFSEDSFFSILRLRGLESNSPDKYAEGYYCRKMVY